MEIQLFQFKNQIKANIQGVSRLCSCLFEEAAKGDGLLCQAGMKQDLPQPVFHLYLAPAGVEWCRPSNQPRMGRAKSLTSSRRLPLPPRPMTACPDIDGQGTGLK